MNRFSLPKLTDHGSEIALLGWLGTGVLSILIIGAFKGQLAGATSLDVAAFLLVLQRIIEAITARWTQRSVDRMGQQLGASQPTADGPTGSADDPLTVEQAK